MPFDDEDHKPDMTLVDAEMPDSEVGRVDEKVRGFFDSAEKYAEYDAKVKEFSARAQVTHKIARRLRTLKKRIANPNMPAARLEEYRAEFTQLLVDFVASEAAEKEVGKLIDPLVPAAMRLWQEKNVRQADAKYGKEYHDFDAYADLRDDLPH